MYLPRFFHRAKKDSLFISVGSKNLFKVTGSLTETFCSTPLYTNDTFITGVSKSSKNKNNKIINNLITVITKFKFKKN